MTAAQYILQTSFTVSSLETGRVGYVTAWGGSDYGYAYKYAISGAPAGLSLGTDFGILSISSPIAVGTYGFAVTVTSRWSNEVATFNLTLNVVQGVTGVPTGTQIQSKTYTVDSGAYGTPTGNDYTNVLYTMQAAILADQAAAPDGQLRATVLLRRGNTYQYAANVSHTPANEWMTGIQFWTLQDDPAFPSGAAPIIQCTTAAGNPNSYEVGPFQFGGGSAIDHQGSIKASCATIATVAAGSTQVTMTGGQSNIKVGRWHAVLGNSIQIGGYPPNVAYIDYVKVLSINGNTVTLDRPLKYAYQSDWYEDPTDDNSLGVGRLVPWDCGGSGGLYPSDPRITQRMTMTNITMLANPNYPALIGNCNFASMIEAYFSGCSFRDFLPGTVKNTYCNSCSMAQMEIDKMMEQIIFDSCNTLVVNTSAQEATGVQFFVTRTSTHGCLQISPRQFLSLGSTFDSRGDTNLSLPFTFAYQGWKRDYRWVASGATPTGFFSGGQNGGTWTYSGTGSVNSNPSTIGTDVVWNHLGTGANVLYIPKTYANFEDWMSHVYAGMPLYTDSTTSFPIDPTNWGYVSTVWSPGDGTGVYLTVVWVAGTLPTSGHFYRSFLDANNLVMDSTTVFHSPAIWADPSWPSETSSPFGPTYSIPSAFIPNVYSTIKAQSQSAITVQANTTGPVNQSFQTQSVSKGTFFAAPQMAWYMTMTNLTATVITSSS